MFRLLLAMVLFWPLTLAAHDYEKEGIHIADAWARAPIGAAKSMAGYLSIISMDLNGDRLIAASSDVAARVELHTHTMADGIMRMRQIEGLDINPMGGADLEPGGHHLMFMGLARRLKVGDKVRVTLTFENVGDMEIVLPVKKAP